MSRFKLRSHAEQFTSFEMLRTPQFYVLYAMMLMMGIGGLMVTAQVSSVADTLGIGKSALTLALMINPLANGSGRIFWGWVSDHLGPRTTMIVAFLIQALALVSVLRFGRHSPVGFIVASPSCFSHGARFTPFSRQLRRISLAGATPVRTTAFSIVQRVYRRSWRAGSPQGCSKRPEHGRSCFMAAQRLR